VDQQSHISSILMAVYDELLAEYGPQEWWPTHTGSAWEVMLGALLTQHTTWRNVEQALGNIRSLWGPEGLARPELALEAPAEELEELLRPAGFHVSKPRKVRDLAHFVIEAGGTEALLRSKEATARLRKRLLGVWGIGPETADAVLLYALGRPVFVADAYALRLATRWGLLEPGASYEEIQRLFMDHLQHDAELFNEYHALLVAHGKSLCRPRPLCPSCPLNRDLAPKRQGQGCPSWRCPRL